jgi:DNA-binding transcriptional ArsR family regulator
MWHKRRSTIAAKRQARASVFAALGDETRLSLIAQLCGGQSYSIAQLTRCSDLTRQAIRKHLRVLERVGIVHCARYGRESRFEFDPQPIEEIREYLDLVFEQRDQAAVQA